MFCGKQFATQQCSLKCSPSSESESRRLTANASPTTTEHEANSRIQHYYFVVLDELRRLPVASCHDDERPTRTLPDQESPTKTAQERQLRRLA